MNDAAFKNKDMLEYNYIYTAVIFVVMLFAIICMYSIYMHRQIRQTALFRSIGITKRQLGVMTFYENIVLGIPSLICGAALGAAGTWLILRFALAENIADVKLYIPHKQLLVMALLWTVGIMIARMVINIAALRQLLSQRFTEICHLRKGGDAPVQPCKNLLAAKGRFPHVPQQLRDLLSVQRFDVCHRQFLIPASAGGRCKSRPSPISAATRSGGRRIRRWAQAAQRVTTGIPDAPSKTMSLPPDFPQARQYRWSRSVFRRGGRRWLRSPVWPAAPAAASPAPWETYSGYPAFCG